FSIVGDHTLFNQIDNAIGSEFGVNTQVFVASKSFKYSVGNLADSELKRVAVTHPFRDKMTDFAVNLTRCGTRKRDERFVYLRKRCKARYVEEGVTMGSGHLRIHLPYQKTRGLGTSLCNING